MNAEQTMSTHWRSPCAEVLWRGAQRVCLFVLLGEVIFPALPGAIAGFTFSAEAAAAEWCEEELPEDADPPAVVIGERLFLETRFAQFFFANSHGDANAVLAAGDPVMDTTQTTSEPLPGPFAGQSMNCRACHLVDEHVGREGLAGSGVRAYADFARRSPVPQREDGNVMTPRNSPSLVNASLARRDGVLFHFDGEFATMKDLVKATFTGRNFGWLPGEEAQAIAHIVHIIRDDDGLGALAQETGGPYSVVLKGTDPNIPPEFCLPAPYRMINFDSASDEEIFDTVASLVAVYVRSLTFARDDDRAFNASPYDVFLMKNDLPRKPEGESALEYSRRLRSLLEGIAAPRFVAPADGAFVLHAEDFVFGPDELAGLKLFLAEPDDTTSHSAGNCLTCHPAPNFTDFSFHNTGVTQEEYDALHGQGAFMALAIPGLATRNANFDEFLAPTAAHPQAKGPFLAVPAVDAPGFTDLGLWNVFTNPDLPTAQEKITKMLFHLHGRLSEEELSPKTIAVFKTPGLRDLAQSAPYFHTGGKDTLTDVLQFYLDTAALVRTGNVRNPDPEIGRIHLTPADIPLLRAFLRSLTEDYS